MLGGTFGRKGLRCHQPCRLPPEHAGSLVSAWWGPSVSSRAGVCAQGHEPSESPGRGPMARTPGTWAQGPESASPADPPGSSWWLLPETGLPGPQRADPASQRGRRPGCGARAADSFHRGMAVGAPAAKPAGQQPQRADLAGLWEVASRGSPLQHWVSRFQAPDPWILHRPWASRPGTQGLIQEAGRAPGQAFSRAERQGRGSQRPLLQHCPGGQAGPGFPRTRLSRATGTCPPSSLLLFPVGAAARARLLLSC